MLRTKIKKMTLCLCAMSVLLSPVITHAEAETGRLAANQAAEQRAALAKKAEARKKAAEEKQKAADAQAAHIKLVDAPAEKVDEK